MKANELMIGDWVFAKEQIDDTGTEPVFGGTPKKVVELATGIDGIYLEGEGRYSSIDIEPVPITREILEENGFKHEQGYSSEIYRLDECFLVHYQDDIYWAVWLSENGDENMDKTFTYAHELQHIFKLLNINKEIKL